MTVLTAPAETPAAPPPAELTELTELTRRRLVTPMPTDRVTGWVATGLVFLVALALRLYRLGDPHQIVFDETYYQKDSLDLLQHGYELNKQGTDAGFIVHPPLGKWMIAMGQWVFGVNSTGWRVSAAIVGSLSVLLLARIARRMLRSTLLGCIAGLLLALDGLELVLSRTALLDVFLMFWVIVALGCVVLDRDHGRARMARALESGRSTAWPGPWLGVRWWRLAAGVSLGCACAVKWSGLYYLLALPLLVLAWDVGARRTAGVVAPVRAALVRDWLWAIPSFVVLAPLTYLASWTGWFLTDGGYDRHKDGRHGIVGSLQNLWSYHHAIYDFHAHLSSSHPYASKPLSWLLLGRPVSFYFESPKLGTTLNGQTCHAAGGCYAEILAVGTPAIWWAAIPALIGVAALWVARRDWRAATILVGYAAGLLPWLHFSERTMFLFYAIPMVPFMCLALAMVCGWALGGSDASDNRRLYGSIGVGVYLLLVLACFRWLYPVFIGDVIPIDAWRARVPGWVQSWV